MKKFALSLIVSAVMFTSMTTGVLANTPAPVDTTASTNVIGGNLDFNVPTTFGFDDIELNGEKIVRDTTLNKITVKDARGNGYGWNLHVSATELRNGDNTIEDALKIKKAPSIDFLEGSSEQGVKTNVGMLNRTGFVLAYAEERSGMGTFFLDFATDAIQLTLLPKETFAGTYSTTVTWDLQTGPTQ